MFAVIISEKGGAERREIFQAAEITVGRVQGNDLTLPKGNVSKRHARLAQLEGRFVVTDHNSTNGTYVNRRRITQATIVREGDRIYIGDYVLRVEGLDDDGEVTRKNQTRTLGGDDVVDESTESAAEIEPEALDKPDVFATFPRAPRLPGEEQATRSPGEEVLEPVPVFTTPPAAGDAEASSASVPLPGSLTLVVRSLVDAIVARLEAGALEREVTDLLRRRVERVATEQLGILQRDGAVPPGIGEERIVTAALEEVLDFGPFGALFGDEQVSDITVSGMTSAMITRAGVRGAEEPPFSNAASLERVLQRLCKVSGVPLGEQETLVERTLAHDIRLAALRRPGVGPSLVTLSRVRQVDTSLEELVRRGTISRAIATFLRCCAIARVNILIVGSRGSATADLLAALVSAAFDDHWVCLEDRDELLREHPQVSHVRLSDFRTEAGKALLLAARATDARLAIENFSGDVAVATLDAISQGTEGVVAAALAPSIRRALLRLPADIAAVRGGYDLSSAWEAVVGSFEVLVEVAQLRDGRDRVLRVCEVQRSEDGGIDTADIFGFMVQRTAAGGLIEGTFYASGNEPTIALELRARGVSIESSLFKRPSSS